MVVVVVVVVDVVASCERRRVEVEEVALVERVYVDKERKVEHEAVQVVEADGNVSLVREQLHALDGQVEDEARNLVLVDHDL